jgi:cation transport regulator
MPYATNDDLPLSIRAHLPEHAQDIFRAAFNNAWTRYRGSEAIARRIAWSAVKRRYVKRDIGWVPRSSLGDDAGEWN